MFPHFFIHEKESLGEQKTAARGVLCACLTGRPRRDHWARTCLRTDSDENSVLFQPFIVMQLTSYSSGGKGFHRDLQGHG